MLGAHHYREAERLVAHSKNHVDQGNQADDKIAELAAAQAQVHATLAHAAAVIEAAHEHGAWLINRPTPADDVDPAYPGTPWGRALYGDLHLTKKED